MKIIKRAISMGTMVIMAIGMFGISSEVNASSESTKIVEGSYLTQKETSIGKSQNDNARGEYIMVGECSITKAGRGRIYIYASTTARTTVNYISTIGYVDRYNEEEDRWEQIHFFDKEDEDNYFVMKSQYLEVDSGKYYRVRADHFAGMEYPYESTYSFTDGILVN